LTLPSDPSLQINQIPVSLEIPEEYEEFREIASLLFKRIIDAVNKKTGSLYYLQELGNFQSFFVPGQPFVFADVYRSTFDLIDLNGGDIAGGASVVFPHNILGFLRGTLIYATATATDTTSFTVMLPYAHMDDTNIYFTNPLPSTPLIFCSMVCEYTKN
jgi:hypothetical protein